MLKLRNLVRFRVIAAKKPIDGAGFARALREKRQRRGPLTLGRVFLLAKIEDVYGNNL